MKLRCLSLLLLLLATAPTLHAVDPVLRLGATPTEAAALRAADTDRTAYTLPPRELAKATVLHRNFTALHYLGEAWTLLQLALLLTLGIAARMRDVAVRASAIPETQRGIFTAQLLILHTLLDLPLSIAGHRIALQYGLSIQHWGSWTTDLLKQLIVMYGLGTMGVMLLFLIVRRSPQRWWLWFGLVASGCILAGTLLVPYVYDPLFNTFTPLQQTHPEVVAWGQHLGIPADRMFLMNASAKVTTVNAYVTGIGPSKRIVIWDTSFKPGAEADLQPILAHEMGHYVLNHLALGVGLTMLSLVLEFWIGFHAARWLLRRYGARWKIPSQDNLASLAVYLLLLAVLGFASEPISNSASRWIEHNADVYGQEALHGVVPDPATTTARSFQHLGETSVDLPNPNPLLEFLDYTHPSISHRAAFAKAYDPWTPGNAPKYFPKECRTPKIRAK
jgi:Zn-dependent protease with chaperone function